jgi:hypothetical protein
MVLCCAALSHGAPAIDVVARVDQAEVTVGDPILYEIIVTHPAAARVELPAVRGNTGALEVTDYAVRTATDPDGRARVTYALTLAAFAVGRDTLPPQRVEVRQPPDTAMLVLYTQPTFITIKSVAPAQVKDIAEIHDAERLPGVFPWALPVLLAVVLAAWYGLRRLARRPKPLPAATVRLLTAEEHALERLLALENAGLPAGDPATSRAFAFSLSEILREYLAGRFQIDALEATTVELMQRVTALPMTAAQQEWLWHMCAELDAVKFATGTLAPAAADRLLQETRDFVHAFPPAVPASLETTATGAANPMDAAPETTP